MKKLYFLLLFFSSIFLHAQNWQAVYSDRVVYFDDGLQAIKIVNVDVDSTGDSTFKNYPQFFVDSIGRTRYMYGRIKDSTSWIGKRIYIKADGYNGFVNDSNETIWLNTLARVNDTFTFLENKKVLIKGYCNKMFYADTFGISDSLKQFKFLFIVKPGNKFKIDTANLKGFEILLSKHSGLLQTPSYAEIWFTKDGGNIYETFKKYSPQNYFTNRRFHNLDVGDEYEYLTKNDYQIHHYYENRYYYQVISKENVPGTDSIKYTFLVRHHNLHQYRNIYWDLETETKHYVYNQTKTLLVNDDPVNGWLSGQLVMSNSYVSQKLFYFNDTCELQVNDEFYGYFSDTIEKFFQPPFEIAGGSDYYSYIGALSWFIDVSTAPNGSGEQYYITYKNFCNTQYGTPWAKYYVYGVGMEEVGKESISLYPNPAQNAVSIKANGIQTIKLFDISGKQAVVKFIINENEAIADVSTLADGVYFIVTETIQGTSTHKLIVNH